MHSFDSPTDTVWQARDARIIELFQTSAVALLAAASLGADYILEQGAPPTLAAEEREYLAVFARAVRRARAIAESVDYEPQDKRLAQKLTGRDEPFASDLLYARMLAEYALAERELRELREQSAQAEEEASKALGGIDPSTAS